MRSRFLLPCVSVLCLAVAPPALGLANRVFVSQRSGNDANSCDNILTPCKTFAGAVLELNPGGEAIVLDSGGYGPVTITQSLTIEAPAGVTAFIHPPSGDAITINAGASDVVTLRGLVLNVGTDNGIKVSSVGTLDVESCFITGFFLNGIEMLSAGRLDVKRTDISRCGAAGIIIENTSGLVRASIDRCHLDGNDSGFYTVTTSPGSSTTTATNTTANDGTYGWWSGNASSGTDVLNLEFCSGSENSEDGIYAGSDSAESIIHYSSCVFANNGVYGVHQVNSGAVQTRGNDTITGNGTAPTHGTIGPFSGT